MCPCKTTWSAALGESARWGVDDGWAQTMIMVDRGGQKDEVALAF
jgi:hypothetical protein